MEGRKADFVGADASSKFQVVSGSRWRRKAKQLYMQVDDKGIAGLITLKDTFALKRSRR